MIVHALLRWPARRWLVALLIASAVVVLIGVPTAMIETPLFSREIPDPWWAWPSLVVSALLAGLLAATYVAPPEALPEQPEAVRKGWFGGALTFFAVGCPVCNKLVLLALGSAGAITWFEPVQPVLQALAIGLLAWALAQRLRGEIACSLTDREAASA